MEIKMNCWEERIRNVKLILEIDSLTNRNRGKMKVVGKFKSKARNKHYTSPRIVLGKGFKNLVGKHYYPFRGKANFKTLVDDKEEYRIYGDCVFLFFSEESLPVVLS
jgi:hypothetical protein